MLGVDHDYRSFRSMSLPVFEIVRKYAPKRRGNGDFLADQQPHHAASLTRYRSSLPVYHEYLTLQQPHRAASITCSLSKLKERELVRCRAIRAGRLSFDSARSVKKIVRAFPHQRSTNQALSLVIFLNYLNYLWNLRYWISVKSRMRLLILRPF